MSDQHEYVFMTLRTLDDLRRKREADSIREQLARAKNTGERPPFSYYRGKRVITVHRGLMPDGEIWTEPTPAIMEWLRRTQRTAPFAPEIETSLALR